MNVALFGKRLLAGVMKRLEMKVPSWIVWLSPKSNEKCPYSRHTGETHRRGGGNVKTGAEMGRDGSDEAIARHAEKVEGG